MRLHAAALLVLAAPLSAQPLNPLLWDHPCPIDMARDCPGTCGSDRCRMGAYPCDLRVCWEDVRLRAMTEAVRRTVSDPASFRYEGSEGVARGLARWANPFHEIRLTIHEPGIRLEGERFILYLPALLRNRSQTRLFLSNATRWMRTAWESISEQILARADSPVAYSLEGCHQGRCRLVPVTRMDPLVPVARPEPPQPLPEKGSPAGAPSNSETMTDRAPNMRQIYEWAQQRSGEELRRMLGRSRDVSVMGRVITVDGVPVFSDTVSRERMREAFSRVSPGEEAAAVALHSRMVQDAIIEVKETQGPPPDGHRYDFNEETGEVDVVPLDDEDLLKPVEEAP